MQYALRAMRSQTHYEHSLHKCVHFFACVCMNDRVLYILHNEHVYTFQCICMSTNLLEAYSKNYPAIWEELWFVEMSDAYPSWTRFANIQTLLRLTITVQVSVLSLMVVSITICQWKMVALHSRLFSDNLQNNTMQKVYYLDTTS